MLGLVRSWAPQMADEGERIEREKTIKGTNNKNLESFHGDHPRRDGGPQVLGSKRSEGNIFPLLDVPRGPVIHEDHSEDVLVCLLGGDGLAHGWTVATNEESHLELKVHQAAWTKLWWLSVNRPGSSTHFIHDTYIHILLRLQG